MSTKTVQVKPLTLSSGIGTSNTTAIVSGMIGLDGADLTQADFGTIIYGTFEPNTAREEAVSFTITSNTGGIADIDFGLTGRGRLGKAPYGTGGITYSHAAGAKLVISNNPDLFNKFTAKDNDEEVTGSWEFPAPVNAANPVTKAFFETALANQDDTAVHITGDESIDGTKTFTESPIVPDAGADQNPLTKGQFDDQAVILTTDQSIDGVKTFLDNPIVPDATAAQHPLTKGQFDASTQEAVTKSTNLLFGSVKLDAAATDPAQPIVVSRSSVINESGRNATPSVDVDKLVKLEADGYLSANFVRQKIALTTFETFNITTPTPAMINSDGTILRSSAAASSGRQKFHGFINNIDTTALLPRYVGGSESNSNTFSLTVPAGTNRYLLVFSYQTGSGVVQPTAMTWNGSALTRLTTTGTPNSFVEVWGLALGTGASTTANVVVSSAAGSFVSHQAVVYDNVRQVSSIADSDVAASASVSTLSTPSLTAVDPFSLFVYGGTSSVDVTLAIGSTTLRQNSSQVANRARTGDFSLLGNSVATVTTGSSAAIALSGIVLRAAAAIAVDLNLDRVVGGFTGLTPGANYFVSNTTGQISTSAGTLSIPVGIALTATQIYVNL